MILGLWGLLSPLGAAADLYVGGGHPFADITTAAAAAQDGDTIWVDPGRYDEAVDFDSLDVHVRRGGPGTVRWTATAGTALVTTTGTLRLEGLELDGLDQRRILSVTGGNLIVQDCILRNGRDVSGGAIRANLATVEVIDSRFEHNRASISVGHGGAIHATDSALTVERSVFLDNVGESALSSGGAIRIVNGGPAVVNDSVFVQNSAPFSGGGIAATGVDLIVVRSLFSENTAAGEGGAVLAETGASAEIRSSTFRANVSQGNAGAVLVRTSPTALIDRNLFCANEAGVVGRGGSVQVTNSTVAALNNVFGGNTAWGGGAFAAATGGSVDSTNNTYAGNFASFGGAFYDESSTATSVNDMVIDNTAAGQYALYAANFTDPISYGLLYGNQTFDHNWVAGLGVVSDVPLLVGWPGLCSWGSFELDYGSPAIDAGDPAIMDGDGSTSDIGALGGPGAPWEMLLDADADGYIASDDCDDNDATIHPAAAEICDRIDNDCDYLIDGDDPDVTGLVDTWPDADVDGRGDYYGSPSLACPSADLADNDEDCFDDDSTTWEGPVWFKDDDGDGLGDPLVALAACEQPAGHVANGDDCDDDEPAILGPDPYYADSDSDGYGAIGAGLLACIAPPGMVGNSLDCDDNDANNYPTNAEICDGQDNNCDDLVDDQDPLVDLSTALTWYLDADDDTYGAGVGVDSCTPPADSVNIDGDCDDGDPDIFPGAEEHCDNTDEDCDGTPDNDAVDATLYYDDADTDGYGLPGSAVPSCLPIPDAAIQGGDCDDGDAAINPGAEELCDGVDNNCDDVVDDDAIDAVLWYLDNDGDDHGQWDADALLACTQPVGYGTFDDDCDDTAATTYPGAQELCNDDDDDCDDEIDEGLVFSSWFPDLDADNYGDANAPAVSACAPPPLHVADHSDCDDTNPDAYPGAPEQPANEVDEDCDGADAVGDNTRDFEDPEPEDEDKSPGGCGCSSAPDGPPSLALLLLTSLFLRRRYPR